MTANGHGGSANRGKCQGEIHHANCANKRGLWLCPADSPGLVWREVCHAKRDQVINRFRLLMEPHDQIPLKPVGGHRNRFRVDAMVRQREDRKDSCRMSVYQKGHAMIWTLFAAPLRMPTSRFLFCPAVSVSAWNGRGDTTHAVFLNGCFSCHGKDGKAQTSVARKLGVKDLSQSRLDEAQIEQQIREGRPADQHSAKMPAFKD